MFEDFRFDFALTYGIAPLRLVRNGIFLDALSYNNQLVACVHKRGEAMTFKEEQALRPVFADLLRVRYNVEVDDGC